MGWVQGIKDPSSHPITIGPLGSTAFFVANSCLSQQQHLQSTFGAQEVLCYPFIKTKQKYPNMPVDLLHPTPESEMRTHKLKRLVQSPNSFFMDIKCPGCFQITTVFSHAQTVVLCGNCNIQLCQPTGGKARLTEGCSYRKKVD
ncbi:unnamed protein product [Cylindrotheca closterium]|uniref:40S ribosomal protein S27 n=1 Tax=Cylindrotheca closterium TaxID=2856 RepID=A0AAD2JMK1_9STRA|nr:unnamed protein product [Cylindrotheca closterium]